MAYDPQRHHRRSVRLSGHDYAQVGAYFVTICSKNGACLFGDVRRGEMILTEWGQILMEEWKNTQELRSNIELDVYQVMPNHFHALLWIIVSGQPVESREFAQPQAGSLGTIVGAFKSAVTHRINGLRHVKGVSVWQRSFYDQIIRNERHLTAVRQYILNNPANWEADTLHPDAPPNQFNKHWHR